MHRNDILAYLSDADGRLILWESCYPLSQGLSDGLAGRGAAANPKVTSGLAWPWMPHCRVRTYETREMGAGLADTIGLAAAGGRSQTITAQWGSDGPQVDRINPEAPNQQSGFRAHVARSFTKTAAEARTNVMARSVGLFICGLDLREWRCVQDEGLPPLVYRHEPSEDEARPSLVWMLGGHYSCNIE